MRPGALLVGLAPDINAIAKPERDDHDVVTFPFASFAMTMRVALYARYSTDLQREASIDDQLRLCQAHAERQGWIVAGSYFDRAISGATRHAKLLLVKDTP